MGLNGAQKRYLRALAHPLKPVVMIGQRGVTKPLLTQVEQALNDHELIKVKLTTECPYERDDVGAQLASESGADCAGAIGRVIILYRAHPESPTIRLPVKGARTGLQP
jgi:RNA-binding protein